HRGTSPWWVSDNGAGVSTLYDGEGVAQFGTPPLVVSVTGAGGGAAAPTGVVGNTGSAFVVASGGAQGPAFFIFASEDGTISGWNPNVPPPIPPATRSTTTVVAVDASPDDAVFKGITIASTASGDRLYATDFHNARVDVFDGSFAPVSTSGGFLDPSLPAGYAPFGIRAIGGTIYVTYALKETGGDDDVPGKHHGFVDAFTPDGVLLRRVASGGKLDSPWGLALAPEDGFGRFGGKLLVGNFGDGHIVGYTVGEDAPPGDGGAYLTGKGGRITIDGLWGIDFGNGAAAGPTDALFFAAGPNDEEDGLFGRIDFVHGND
ncbi:MAG TPA: TIGR03118 family protein, partial [Anaeromyxobacter sp.]|nr:TIGR03118 family protein [Anaeromyxobacter sp.]